ncbi:MAG: S66 peptidase family protein [Velocimicrobium sp.]
MIYPKFLEKGDRIGVTAPSDGNSNFLDYIRLDHGIDKLTSLGFPVVETPNVRTSIDGRSADKKRRAEEFLSLIRHPKVKAIISAKGGDFLCEMLSLLDFDEIRANPKWMQGYSDNTGILFTVTTACDMATLYGNNFNDFGMDSWHESVINDLELLKGNLVEQTSFDFHEDEFHDKITGLEGYERDKKVYWQHTGEAKEIIMKGRLIGGCLDVLLNLVGTRFDFVKSYVERYQKDGILWYLESFETNREAITRGLWQLKEAGWFAHASGFIFGRPCMYPSDSKVSYRAAVEESLGELNLPMVFDADIGHKGPQFTVINGAYGCVYSGYGKGRFLQELRK